MTRLSLAAFACLLTTDLPSPTAAGDKAVVRLDPALDALVSPDAKVELVKGGFGFTEGPVWMQQGKSGYLLFTDIPGNVVWKLTPDGKASVYLEQRRLPGAGGVALGRHPEQRLRAQRSALRGIRHDRRRRPHRRPPGPPDPRHLRAAAR